MAVAMCALVVVMLLSPPRSPPPTATARQREERPSESAYAAAEAGIADYQYHLNQKPRLLGCCERHQDKSPVTRPFTVDRRLDARVAAGGG
jgi:hypothetical protein